MVPLLGLFLLLPVSLASRIHGLAQSRSIQKRPSVDFRNQQQQDGQLLRLPMSRRPPKFTKKSNIGARNRKAGSLAHLRASKTHHTSTHTSSAKSTPTPIAANTSSFFQDAAYGIDLWIGNYPQRVTLDFDTGSSETWVSPPCTGWADYPEYEDLCRLLGTYIPEQSSSMIDNSETCDPSWIMYGSGDVYIAYYQDDIRFSDPYRAAEQFEPELGAVAQQVRFGLAIDAENMPSGIFGASYGAGYNQDYNSVIDDMHEQGVIATKDFSVALGSVGGENGEVIFGGIDVAKFTGELHEIEISHQLPKMMDGYYRYWINVTSIGVTKPGSCETVPVTPKGFDERFLPDTGTSLTYMPSEAFNKILEAFPDAQLSGEGFGYTVDCSHRTADGTIDYTFPDGFTVHVPFSEFIFLVPGDATTNFEDTCIIGAVATESLFILGDTFLRAVYAVFSQEHHKVYLAQYQDCGTHVVPSKGKNNKGMKGICSEAGHGVGDKQGRHYGYPTSTSAAAGVCTSYSTAPHPKWSSTSTDVMTLEFRNTGLFRPAIQTGPRPPVPTTSLPVRSTIGPPWGGNVTSSLGHGTAGSTGFLPVPTGASSSVSQFSFESFSSSSTRADVPTITLSPFPTTSSSSCASSSSSSEFDFGSSVTTDWFTWDSSSSSSSSYDWFTSSSSESLATPVVTIPVEPHETIVVKLQSTTYTIVDGTTVEGEVSSSTSFDPSSWYSSVTKHKHDTSTSSDSWDTSFSWETLSFTTFSDEPSTTSTKKKHTTTSSSTHKKTKTTSSTSSYAWETSASSSSIDPEAGGYLTSWIWNPTGTSEIDPFYTSSTTTYDDDSAASSSWAWESSVSKSFTFWSSTPISDPFPEFSMSSSSFDLKPSSSSSDDGSSWSSTSSIPESTSSESSWSWSWSASPTSSSSWDWGSSTSSIPESSTSTSESSWSWDWGSSTSSSAESSTTSSWDWGDSSSSTSQRTTTTESSSASASPSSEFSSIEFSSVLGSIAVSEAPSATTTVILTATAIVTETWTPFLAKRQTQISVDNRPTLTESIVDGTTEWIDSTTTIVEPDWETTMIDTPLSFGTPSSGTTTVMVTETVMITVTAAPGLEKDIRPRFKDFYIPPSSLHIMPWQTDAAVPPNGLEKRVHAGPGDSASGYDSGYESGFEAGSGSGSENAGGDCDFLSSSAKQPTSDAKAMDCLRAMEAHQNKGRSVAFCKSYLSMHGHDEHEKESTNAGMKIPRYLQSSCELGSLEEEQEDNGGAASHGTRLISQACKCLISSPGRSGFSSDQVWG
ncbi:hypothetical protein V8F33_013325 [Rhypophila sp. PSN 637]